MEDGVGAGLGEFDKPDADAEAELRRKEKEARKRKKKKEKKRRERERARLEAEQAGAASSDGGSQALDMVGAGDIGSGGDDDDFTSPLNSARGQNDGGLDGLYDEVFSGTAGNDPGGGGGIGGGGGGIGGRNNDGIDGFRSMTKKPPPARLPTLGGLPGLPEPRSLPSLPGDGGHA